jgi:hypothetical protein
LPTLPLPLAALLLGLLGAPGTPAELPAAAEVVVEELEAFLEPDAASIAPERLKKGEKVRVVDADSVSGWLTIEPPPSAFAWIERSAIRDEGPGLGRMRVSRAVVRAGVPKARMPGPPRSILEHDARVQRLDRPELVVGTGPQATRWVAIAPPSGEVRHVRAVGVTWVESVPPSARAELAREVRAAFEPGAKTEAGSSLPTEIAAEVARIEAEHRAVLGGAVEGWRLEPIRARYESLLKRAADPGSIAALHERLDLVGRHEEIARSARTFQTLLDRSRRRDLAVVMTRRQLAELDRPQRRPFAAEGLVQPSSRQVDGHRVYALIGPEGTPVAYLDVPPGLDARAVLSRRAGVRGSVRYNESLGARLIAVKELEPLE